MPKIEEKLYDANGNYVKTAQYNPETNQWETFPTNYIVERGTYYGTVVYEVLGTRTTFIKDPVTGLKLDKKEPGIWVRETKHGRIRFIRESKLKTDSSLTAL